MSDSNQVSLRNAIAADYDGLIRRLTRYLGSKDLARETLHEAFLRIERVSEVMAIKSPADYLFRIAVNTAKDRRKHDRYLLTDAEIDVICDIPDDDPDPSEIVESRLELRQLGSALSELSERRRSVFLAVHVEGLTHRAIADRLGVTVRTVLFDLQYTMEHLSRRLGRKFFRRLGPAAKVPETD